MMRNKKTYARTIVTSFIFYGLLGCGVFDLREPNAPADGSGNDDPLSIGDILSIDNASVVYMDYHDYFTANAVYEDHLMMYPVRGRNAIVAMLERLLSKNVRIDWHVERGDRRPDGSISGVPYTVYSGGLMLCGGSADFQIVRESQLRISNWRDTPDVGCDPLSEL